MSTELDKFKRRVIRSVARVMRQGEHDKQADDKMWEDLQKEVGCDCKLLWERMRTLTLKKMKRLLPADDRLHAIADVAQMQLTDWLLFDLVLVHEDITVITENPNSKCMKDLINLVQMFEIEGKTGDRLTGAWTAATFYYNSFGRQCSPMLLQRRWYQLKKATRDKFYAFWFSYRGNLRLLESAKNKPNALHSLVAKRYPYIVTKPFREWNELIQEKFVILPEEFEAKMRSKKTRSKSDDSNEPDVILVEQRVETIDLRVESDTENDSENSKNGDPKNETDDDSKIKSSVNIKQEIEDEMNNYSEIETVQERNITLETDEELDYELNDAAEAIKQNEVEDINDDDTREAVNVSDNTNIDGIPVHEETATVKAADNTENETEAVQSTNKTGIVVKSESDVLDIDDDVIAADDEPNINNEVGSKGIEDKDLACNIASDDVITVDDMETSEANDEVKELDNDVVELDTSEEKDQSTVVQEEIVMPQILNVFGNVTVKAEVLAALPLSKTTLPKVVLPELPKKPEDIDQVVKEKALEFTTPLKEEDAIIDVSQSEVEVNETPPEFPPIPKNDSELHIKTENSRPINPFIDIPADVTFEDNGIELVDDGIAFNEEDDELPNKTIEIKSEKRDKHSQDNSAFDLKLLMQPIVYSVKLENMTVFKNIDINSVADKSVIDSVLVESKPILLKLRTTQKPEVNSMIKLEENRQSSSSDTEDEDSIPESSKVKLSSSLFQKPRSRNYNPIQLCKNPDFNTRLKRLTVGFLSSMRNRSLLRSLKPMTIDVSKTFEGKLIDGTVYLKSGESPIKVKREVINEKESEQTISILPLAMPVQSLINNTNENIPDIMQPSPVETPPEPKVQDDTMNERQKTINLPDINNIRQLNKHLLTVEVAPMMVGGGIDKYKPPVHIIKTPSEEPLETKSTNVEKYSQIDSKQGILPLVTNTPDTNKNNISVMAFEDVLEKNKVIDKVANEIEPSAAESKGKNDKPTCAKSTNKIIKKVVEKPRAPYKIIPRQQPLTWNTTKKLKVVDNSLLTLDTLQRMLNVCSDGEVRMIASGMKPSQLRKALAKRNMDLEKRVEEYEESLKNLNDESTQVDNEAASKDSANEEVPEVVSEEDTETATESEAKPPPTKKPKIKVIKDKPYGDYCCWARLKLCYLNAPEQSASKSKKHQCPRICACCCRNELANKTKWSSKKRVKAVTTTNIVISDDDENEKIYDVIEGVVNNVKSSCKPHNVCNAKSSNRCDLRQQTIPSKKELKEIARASQNIMSVASEVPKPVKPHVRVLKHTCMRPVQQVTLDDGDDSVSKSLSPHSINQSSGSGYQSMRSTILKNADYLDTRPRGHIIIDGTKKLTVHKKAPSTASCFKVNDHNTKEKVVYLNRSKNKKKAPIYLGKNKILLTDIKFESDNLNTQVVQYVQQQTQITTMVMPEGVQLVMLPNGMISYTVAVGVELTDEQKANIPPIIDAVQRQLNQSGFIPSLLNSKDVPLTQVNINESNTATANTEFSGVVNTIQGIGNENTHVANEEIQPTETLVPMEKTNSESVPTNQNLLENPTNITNTIGPEKSEDNENITSVDKNRGNIVTCCLSPKEIIPIHDTCTSEANEPSLQNIDIINSNAKDRSITEVTGKIKEVSQDPVVLDSTQENVATEQTVPSEVEANTEQTNPAAVTNESISENITQNQEKSSELTTNAEEMPQSTVALEETEKNYNENQKGSSENTVANTDRKSLLTDLMQMSGILDEMDDNVSIPIVDTEIPYVVPNDTLPGVTLPAPVLTTALLPNLLRPNLLAGDIQQAAFQMPHLKPISKGTTSHPHLPELTPITTYEQLKDAVDKGGKFFKLDLVNGTLSAGIKVCIKKQLPKSVIDLTEDDDGNEEVQITETSKSSSPQEPMSYTLPKGFNRSLLKENNKGNDPVKPIKLFRSVRILRKDTEHTVLIPAIEAMPSLIAKNKTRRRKQDIYSVRNNAKSPLSIDDDYESTGSLDQYIYRDSDFLDSSSSSYDSSDDEPLASKAKRIRVGDTQKDNATNNKEQNAKNTEVDIGVERQADTTENAGKEQTEQWENLPQDEQMDLSENLVQHLPESLMAFMPGDDDDNCILGV